MPLTKVDASMISALPSSTVTSSLPNWFRGGVSGKKMAWVGTGTANMSIVLDA